MESSFTPTEELLNSRISQQKNLGADLPYQEILLTRLSMHVQSKLLEKRNNMLKSQGINETLFMALMILILKNLTAFSLQNSAPHSALPAPMRPALRMNSRKTAGLSAKRATMTAAVCICT